MEPREEPACAEAERVERATAALSPLEREVLVLTAGHGLRIPDIALRLGISERRAQRLLARALTRFDRALHPPERPWWRFW